MIERCLNPSSSKKPRSFEEAVSRPEFTTASHLTVFVSADVQLQVHQGAAQGQRRQVVVRNISSVGEQSVKTLSVPIWFNGWRRSIVVRHVMQ